MPITKLLIRWAASLAVSLFFAETLALVHIAGLSLRSGTNVFRLPGVLSVATFAAVCGAVLFTPLGFWAARIGAPRLVARVAVLWVVLAIVALVLSVLSQTGAIPFIAVFAAIGVAMLGVATRPETTPPN